MAFTRKMCNPGKTDSGQLYPHGDNDRRVILDIWGGQT